MAEESDRAELIKKRLVVNESEIFDQLLSRMERILMLDSKGEVFLKVPKDKLTNGQMIAVFLAGKKFANMAGLSKTDVVGPNDLALSVGMDAKVVSARVAELRQKGWIEVVARGQWRIAYLRIVEILDEIEMALKGGRT